MLNIKNIEAVTLVDELANLTGESKTQVVIVAVRERLERERRSRESEKRARAILRIGEKAASYGRVGEDHAQLLFDEEGLPR